MYFREGWRWRWGCGCGAAPRAKSFLFLQKEAKGNPKAPKGRAPSTCGFLLDARKRQTNQEGSLYSFPSALEGKTFLRKKKRFKIEFCSSENPHTIAHGDPHDDVRGHDLVRGDALSTTDGSSTPLVRAPGETRPRRARGALLLEPRRRKQKIQNALFLEAAGVSERAGRDYGVRHQEAFGVDAELRDLGAEPVLPRQRRVRAGAPAGLQPG